MNDNEMMLLRYIARDQPFSADRLQRSKQYDTIANEMNKRYKSTHYDSRNVREHFELIIERYEKHDKKAAKSSASELIMNSTTVIIFIVL